jgi:histidinol-phosphatase (PHP family)
MKSQLVYENYNKLLFFPDKKLKFSIHYGKSTHHCHTKRSDGANTAQEMIEMAINKGFTQIGISDHINVHPCLDASKIVWTMPFEEVASYVEDLKKLREAYKDKITVRIGAEVDFFPDFTPGIVSKLKEFDFDYFLGSVHMLGEESIDGCYKDWVNFSQEQIDEHYVLYWQTLKSMVSSNLFDIVSHMDLPKKFGFYPSAQVVPEIDEIIDSILKIVLDLGMWVEINTAGVKLPCKDFYPRESILQSCKKLGIPLIMNDDSHSTKDLGQFFQCP